MILHRKIKAVLGIIGACVVFTSCNSLDMNEKENTEYVNLSDYFNINQVGENAGAAVIIDGYIRGNGIVKDGGYYIPYEYVREYMDDHYYWDSTENILTYASSKHVYDVANGAADYTVDGQKKEHDKQIVVSVDDIAYIDKDFVLLMNGAVDIKIYENPHRIVVTTEKKVNVADIKEDTRLRTEEGVEYPIVADVKKGDAVWIISEFNGWMTVKTENGLVGCIESSKLTEVYDKDIELDSSWIETSPYAYINHDYTLCIGWHQMEYEGGNDSLGSMISKAESLNVISPTWFKITDEFGTISSLASKSYVKQAHNKGLEVWGLISDFNSDEEGNYYINSVVTVTSSRRKLIDNIIKEATECGMDGINIDFEKIRLFAAEGYVQFMRELAIECEKAGLVLSADMYVPTESNSYYDRQSIGEVADYLIIMGYDEHWAGCGKAGSVASLPYVKQGIIDTLSEVPASRVINAIPFYTRIWYEDTLENAPEGSIIVEDKINGDYALSSVAKGMGSAKKMLNDNKANIRWLEDIGQYYGEYYTDNRLVRIWLEDKKSLDAKLSVMKENKLAGVACWKLGLESDEAWDAIKEYMK